VEGGDLALAERAPFLASIRDRTARYQPTHSPTSVWTHARPPDAGRAAAVGDLSARFLEELEALGGHGRRVEDLAAAREAVLALARERGAERLVRWDDDELERLGVDGPLREQGIEVAVWRDLADFRKAAGEAGIGLTGADWAVAETGSILLAGGQGRGRSAALLPPVHIAVVPVERIVATLEEAVAHYAQAGEVPSSLAFHTGPSRSGDIEMTLTVGVHGPGDVHVLLVAPPHR